MLRKDTRAGGILMTRIIRLMEKIAIDIFEENDKIVCEVELPRRNRDFDKTYKVQTNAVIDHLLNHGYDIGELLEEETRITNMEKNSKHRGTWVFKKNVPKKVPKPRTKKTTNTKK